MRVKDAVGRFGEDAAARHLRTQGFQVLQRNWRCALGELDIIAVQGDTLVFVEVKTRSSTAYGLPAEAVTAAKAARLRRLAAQWIVENRDEAGWQELRIDVISVLRHPDGSGVEIDHVRGAVG